MSETAQIELEVQSKSDDRPDSYFLDRLVENYRVQYDISTEITNRANTAVASITFLSRDQVSIREANTIQVFDLLLRNHFQQENGDKFAYMQRIVDYRDTQHSATSFFLTVRFSTVTPEIFQEYFSFLNQFFPLLKILCFFEEIAEGFLIYFEREQDFEDFLFNFISHDSITEFFKAKHLDVPNTFYQDMIQLIWETLVNQN